MDAVAMVDAAVDAHDLDALDDGVRELVRVIDEVDVSTLRRLAEDLRSEGAFEALGLLADSAVASGRSWPFWAELVQAHIERGTYVTATALIETALADPGLAPEARPHLLGQRGRVMKDRFMTSGAGDHLGAAVDAYARGVQGGGDLLWLGLNAHALAHLARRHGIAVDDLDIPSETEVMTAADLARATGDDWAEAAWIEAHLLVGLPVPADAIATRLRDASSFVLGSLRRQLTEVWQLAPDHPAIVTLSEFLLRSGRDADIALPADPAGYEKMFGTEWPVPIDTYRNGLGAAASVCHLMLAGSIPIGTGFVMDGGELHGQLADRTVMITNEHVVPSPERGDGVTAGELTARFDAVDAGSLDSFRAVWWSDRTELDIALLVSDQLDRAPIVPLRPADQLPVVRPGAHVYVIGHPGGGALSLSIRGNDLIDHDGSRIHYRAPTRKGSSGSPVFDHAWNLIGVHHYGSPRLPALNARGGTYEGNQGSAIGALRQELDERGVGT